MDDREAKRPWIHFIKRHLYGMVGTREIFSGGQRSEGKVG